MLRQAAHPRTTFAAPPSLVDEPERVRHEVARAAAAVGRLLLLPLVAVGGALAGLVLLILLPICGIASIAEALARAAWRRLCAGAHPMPPRAVPYD